MSDLSQTLIVGLVSFIGGFGLWLLARFGKRLDATTGKLEMFAGKLETFALTATSVQGELAHVNQTLTEIRADMKEGAKNHDLARLLITENRAEINGIKDDVAEVKERMTKLESRRRTR